MDERVVEIVLCEMGTYQNKVFVINFFWAQRFVEVSEMKCHGDGVFFSRKKLTYKLKHGGNIPVE